MGLSERTDAAVIVVSEETGSISVAENGQFLPNLDADRLQSVLRNLTRQVESHPLRLLPISHLEGRGTGPAGAASSSSAPAGADTGRGVPVGDIPSSGSRHR